MSELVERLRVGRYRHYKGELYHVIGEAEHTETGERMVVYVPLYEIGTDLLRVRSRAMWDEPLWLVGRVGGLGKWVDRFTYVGGER